MPCRISQLYLFIYFIFNVLSQCPQLASRHLNKVHSVILQGIQMPVLQTGLTKNGDQQSKSVISTSTQQDVCTEVEVLFPVIQLPFQKPHRGLRSNPQFFFLVCHK